jgi:homoserine acetyltransferase
MANKLKEMKQTHGVVEKRDISTYRNLDDILGNTGTSKYGTLDENEYVAKIQAMNKSDLQAHAVETASLIPIDDREQLENRLIREFKIHAIQYTAPRPQVRNLIASTPKQKAKLKKALDIMSAGR